MVHMHIKSIIVAPSPLPSAIVLRPAKPEESDSYTSKDEQPEVSDSLGNHELSLDLLPIQVGIFDAACVARSASGERTKRPLTHELLSNVITMMGGKLDAVCITRVEDTTFYAELDITDEEGNSHHIDARPSDAISLAVLTNTPILANEDVLLCGGMPNFDAIAADERTHEEAEFHNFVEHLSPADFNAGNTLK